MPTVNSGSIFAESSHSQGVLSNSLVIQMDDEIHLYDASADPLVALLSEIGKSGWASQKAEWLEDEPIPWTTTVDGAQAAGDTSIEVATGTGSYFGVNSTFVNQRTGEVCLVTAVATDTLTCTRSYGTTAAAAMNDGDNLYLLTNAAAEDATSESALSTEEVAAHNFLQNIRTPYSISGNLLETELYAGNALFYRQRKKAVEHQIAIERAFFFSERNNDTTNARKTMGGLHEWISTNTRDFGGIFTLSDFFSFTEGGFRYGSQKKFGFAGRPVMSSISGAAAQLIRKSDGDSDFGLRISMLESPHGDTVLISHKMFDADYADRFYLLDLENIEYAFQNNRDTQLKTNIQANDRDGRKDEYLSTVGPIRRLEKTCAYGSNMA